MIPGGKNLAESRAYLTARLAERSDRCACGYHVPTQGCHCKGGEWATFVAALRAAVDREGLIHQTSVRPRIQGIPHKHRGLLYRRARTEGLIAIEGKEPSTDVAGRNGDKDQKVYRWLGAEAVTAA